MIVSLPFCFCSSSVTLVRSHKSVVLQSGLPVSSHSFSLFGSAYGNSVLSLPASHNSVDGNCHRHAQPKKHIRINDNIVYFANNLFISLKSYIKINSYFVIFLMNRIIALIISQANPIQTIVIAAFEIHFFHFDTFLSSDHAERIKNQL
jgi:hypothetical protein